MRDIATQYLVCTSERSFKSQRGYILLEIEHPFVPSINKLMTVLLNFFFSSTNVIFESATDRSLESSPPQDCPFRFNRFKFFDGCAKGTLPAGAYTNRSKQSGTKRSLDSFINTYLQQLLVSSYNPRVNRNARQISRIGPIIHPGYFR
jgi:hypothetical protein